MAGFNDEAIAEYQKAITLTNDSYDVIGLARANARSGRRGEAQRLLAQIAESSKHKYYSPAIIGMTYVAPGDKEKAFEYLDEAYQQRDWGLLNLKSSPMFDSLRSDPRFADLLKRMNFPQ